MNKDYYKILGINHNATEDDIKTAYRELAKKYHPDKNGGDENTFKSIQNAYDILKDPIKRGDYDYKMRFSNFGGFGSSMSYSEFYRQSKRSNTTTTWGDIFDIYDDHYNQGHHKDPEPAPKMPGKSLNISMPLTPEQTVKGASEKIRYKRKEICTYCNGTGRTDETFEYSCISCMGSGLQHTTNQISIIIPKGCSIGSKIMFPGNGSQGTDGSYGDLSITIDSLKPSDNFKFDTMDSEASIYNDGVVDILDAISGVDIDVNTVHGNVKYKAKPLELLTCSNHITLKEKGIKLHKDDKTNCDHTFYFDIVMDSHLTEDDIQKFSKIREYLEKQ